MDSLANLVKNNVNVIMNSEANPDSSILKRQFQLHGYSEPYRFDNNGNSGGILFLFVREDIPSTLTESQIRIEESFVELNLRRKKSSYVVPAILNTLKYHIA